MRSGLVLALDLGGTKVEAALARADGTLVPGSRRRAPMGEAAAADADAGRAAIESVVEAALLVADDDVVGAGIGSAGPIDLAEGTVSPINLPAMRDFPLRDLVRRKSGLDEMTLRLDGTCIALAESWRGAARGVRNAIVIVVSTGVGGGIVSDGRLVAGESGNAGHLGQVLVATVEEDTVDATVEGIASGPRSVAWAREQGWDGASGEDLARSYADGVPVAIAAVRRSAAAVAQGLVNATTLLDLDLAVIGGGFSGVAPDYLDLVGDEVRRRAVNAYAGRLQVVAAALGHQAPLLGAAALVLAADRLSPRPVPGV